MRKSTDPVGKMPAQQAQIDQLLRKAYEGALARLIADRWLLDQVVQLLLDRQEIGGAELRAVTASRGATGSGTASATQLQ